jgi:hypothetical protein
MSFPDGFWDQKTVFWPDVSNNNWNSVDDAINFCSQINEQGFAMVCHKVSEGSYYQDRYWRPVKEWCDANGTMSLGYHYVTWDDPAAQAATWRAAGGDNIVMFDWEANSGDMNNFWNVANAFNAAGVNVQVGYCPQWYWNSAGEGDLSQIPFVISSAYPGGGGYASDIYYNQCGGDDGEGWNGYGGATPKGWQFTDNATVSGHSRIDCNAFKGTPQQLQAALGK